MSKQISIAMLQKETAFALRRSLFQLQQEHLIEIEDIVIAFRNAEGDVKLFPLIRTSTLCAIGGVIWGVLWGIWFSMTLFAVVLGAVLGGLVGSYFNRGLDRSFVRVEAGALPANSAAVFILVRDATLEKLIARLERFRGTGIVLRSSLAQRDEAILRSIFSY